MTDSVTEEHSTVTRTTDSIRLMAWLAAAFACCQLKVQRNKEREWLKAHNLCDSFANFLECPVSFLCAFWSSFQAFLFPNFCFQMAL